MSERHTLIIAGQSGSGKSTAALRVAEADPGIAVSHFDHYEFPEEDCDHKADGYFDWEDPINRDYDRLIDDLKLFIDKGTVQQAWERPGGTSESVDIVIVEGHLVLADARIAALGDYSFFFATSHPDRDSLRQYHSQDPYYEETYFYPGEQQFVLPTAERADLVIDTYALGYNYAIDALRRRIEIIRESKA